MSWRYLSAGALLALALVVAPGCGREKAVKVEGVVTLDGTPLRGAMVQFVPIGSAGKPATGVTGDDGTFRLTTRSSNDGAMPGEYKVVITEIPESNDSSRSINPDDPMAMQKAMKEHAERAKKERGQPPPKTKKNIPANYTSEAKTPLKQVIPPDGPIKLELRSSGS